MKKIVLSFIFFISNASSTNCSDLVVPTIVVVSEKKGIPGERKESFITSSMSLTFDTKMQLLTISLWTQNKPKKDTESENNKNDINFNVERRKSYNIPLKDNFAESFAQAINSCSFHKSGICEKKKIKILLLLLIIILLPPLMYCGYILLLVCMRLS